MFVKDKNKEVSPSIRIDIERGVMDVRYVVPFVLKIVWDVHISKLFFEEIGVIFIEFLLCCSLSDAFMSILFKEKEICLSGDARPFIVEEVEKDAYLFFISSSFFKDPFCEYHLSHDTCRFSHGKCRVVEKWWLLFCEDAVDAMSKLVHHREDVTKCVVMFEEDVRFRDASMIATERS